MRQQIKALMTQLENSSTGENSLAKGYMLMRSLPAMTALSLSAVSALALPMDTPIPAAPKTSSPLAEKLSHQAGISCIPAASGDICTIKRIQSTDPKLSYSQPVAILIPKGVSHPAELLLHLHGHRGVCESTSATAAQMAKTFDMLPQMKAAGATNSVMIFPVSQGNCTNFERELVPQFPAFTQYITNLVEPEAGNGWVISGHSGAYRAIGSILGHESKSNPGFVKKIKSVMLLDATYTQRETWYANFKSAANVNPKMNVQSVYIPGGGTHAGSVGLQSRMPKGQVEIIRSSTPNHCQVPNKHYAGLLKKSIGTNGGQTVPDVVVPPVVIPKAKTPGVQAPTHSKVSSAPQTAPGSIEHHPAHPKKERPVREVRHLQ